MTCLRCPVGQLASAYLISLPVGQLQNMTRDTCKKQTYPVAVCTGWADLYGTDGLNSSCVRSGHRMSEIVGPSQYLKKNRMGQHRVGFRHEIQ